MKKLMSILLLCAFTLSAGLAFGQYHPPGEKQAKESNWNPISPKSNVVLKAETKFTVFNYCPTDTFVSVLREPGHATKNNKIRENTNLVNSYKGEPVAAIPVIHSFEVNYLKSYPGSNLNKIYFRNCSIRHCIC